MVKDDQIVCDHTDIILNDGKTLYPGYVEVKDGKYIRWDSSDPINEEARRKPYILHNRVEYAFKADRGICEDEALQGKHFMSLKAMEAYALDKNKDK